MFSIRSRHCILSLSFLSNVLFIQRFILTHSYNCRWHTFSIHSLTGTFSPVREKGSPGSAAGNACCKHVPSSLSSSGQLIQNSPFQRLSIKLNYTDSCELPSSSVEFEFHALLLTSGLVFSSFTSFLSFPLTPAEKGSLEPLSRE